MESTSLKSGDMGLYDIPHKEVMTTHGKGLAIYMEVPYRWHNKDFYRLGVILDNPLPYPIAYFAEHELMEVKDDV